MKKLPIWILVVIVSAAVLFSGISCQQQSPGTTSADETTEIQDTEEDIFSKKATLEFWWWGEEDAPGFSKYLDAMCIEYNKLHPNITVKHVLQSTADTIPALQAALEAKSGPDIATAWYGMYNLETAIWTDGAVPISDYIDEEELSHWLGKEIESYDGKLYGCPIFTQANMMLYNKEQYSAAGLDPDNPPKTWDEFMATCAKLKAEGFAPFTAGFKGGWQFPILSLYMMPQNLTVNEMMQTVMGEKKYTDPEYMDIWNKFDQLSRNEYFIEAASSIDYAEGYPEWRKGNGTHILAGSGQALLWLEELGTEKVGWMEFPQMAEDPVDWVPVMNQAEFITSWSPNKELAADFLKFLHSDVSINAMIEILNGNVLPADDRLDINKLKYPFQKELFTKVLSGYKTGKFYIDSFVPYPIMGDGTIPASQALLVQQITPQEAAEQTEAAAASWREMNPEAFEKYQKWASEFNK